LEGVRPQHYVRTVLHLDLAHQRIEVGPKARCAPKKASGDSLARAFQQALKSGLAGVNPANRRRHDGRVSDEARHRPPAGWLVIC
jgi:hypothetical protein